MEGKRKKIITLVTCFFLLVLAGCFYYINFTSHHFNSVTFFDVGQGDSTLITFDNGQIMLVDCGINRKILSKLGSALPFFDRTIDYLLVTHPDGDHYGGCPAVLERYDVKNIIINGDKKSNDPYWLAWQKYSKLEQSDIKIISGEETVAIGSSELKFLAPDENLKIDDKKFVGNNHSIVFLLKNNLGKFLFTGDMEVLLEDALIKKNCPNTEHCNNLKADYLKVGHHGSDSSSGINFIGLVEPKYSIISVGPNSYGHPSLRTTRKLSRSGSQIWRTDQLNDIIVK